MKPILSPEGEVTNAHDIALHLETVSPRWRALNIIAVDTAPFEHWKYLALSLGLDVAEQERKNEDFRKAIFGDCGGTLDHFTEDLANKLCEPPVPQDPPSRVIPILLTGLGLAAAIGAGACIVKGHGEAAVVLLIVTIACGMRASRTPV